MIVSVQIHRHFQSYSLFFIESFWRYPSLSTESYCYPGVRSLRRSTWWPSYRSTRSFLVRATRSPLYRRRKRTRNVHSWSFTWFVFNVFSLPKKILISNQSGVGDGMVPEIWMDQMWNPSGKPCRTNPRTQMLYWSDTIAALYCNLRVSLDSLRVTWI